jgi:hypothetical protein
MRCVGSIDRFLRPGQRASRLGVAVFAARARSSPSAVFAAVASPRVRRRASRSATRASKVLEAPRLVATVRSKMMGLKFLNFYTIDS